MCHCRQLEIVYESQEGAGIIPNPTQVFLDWLKVPCSY